jgi:PncC family amidohydrolase
MTFKNVVPYTDFPNTTSYRFEPYDGDGDVRSIVRLIMSLLRRYSATLSCGEMLTGGMISSLLTEYDDSTTFKGGVIIQSQDSLEKILDVPPIYCQNYGFISGEISAAMGKCLMTKFDSNHSLVVNGSSPLQSDFSSHNKGIVWLAIHTPKRYHVQRIDLTSYLEQKDLLREKACYAALKIFLQILFEDCG